MFEQALTTVKKKRILILGGGISGLSAAYALVEKGEYEVTLLEASDHIGGLLGTRQHGEFLFEQTARTYVRGRSASLLKLIGSLNLEERLIFSQKSAKKRYLWTGKKLEQIDHPRFLLPLVPDLMAEWFKKPNETLQDETIADFTLRRFGNKVLERLIDPMVLGIYAGKSEELSIQACFPRFKEWETRYGSCLRGLWKERRGFKNSSLFSFQGGVQVLIDSLQGALKSQIQLNEQVHALHVTQKGVTVETQERVFHADYLISALPTDVIGRLFSPLDPSISQRLLSIATQSVTLVHLGYKSLSVPVEGFGYLVPSSLQENLLGTLFDSSIFPQQNLKPDQRRLTLILRHGTVAQATDALYRHLKITELPDCTVTASYQIPQYHLGHLDRILALRQELSEKFPQIHLLGNYLEGVSVNDCVAGAFNLTEKLNLEAEHNFL